MVGAEPRLVAERPEDDRRVVLVALRHPRDAVDPLREVAVVVAERALEGVRFDVGLVDDVQPELVGQVEEGRVVGVVRGPDRVEPELLHEDQVGAHRLGRDDPPGVLVEVVAVDAAEEDPGTVDQEVEPDDLDPPEADLDRDGLGDRAIRGVERDVQRVAVRLLRGPAPDGRDLDVPGDEAVERRCHPAVDDVPRGLVLGRQEARRVTEHQALIVAGPALEAPGVDRGRGGPGGLVRALECRLDRPAGWQRETREADGHGQVERAGRQVVGESGIDPHVGEVDLAGRVQVDRSRDPAVPPLVLVLDEGRVRPLDHAQGQRVAARSQAVGQVELRGQVRILAGPDLVAVEAHDEHALGRADVEDDAPAGPCRRDLELALVDARRVEPPGSVGGRPSKGICTFV